MLSEHSFLVATVAKSDVVRAFYSRIIIFC